MIHLTVWGCTESPNPEIDILVQATDDSRDDRAAMGYAQDKNFSGIHPNIKIWSMYVFEIFETLHRTTHKPPTSALLIGRLFIYELGWASAGLVVEVK